MPVDHMFKAIIFDMDGVIIDSEVAWPEIEFERYSRLIKGWTRDDHKYLTGLSLHDSYRMFKDRFGLEMTWEEYSGFYKKAAEEVYYQRCEMLPGCLDLLGSLKMKGITMGLASSSPNYWIDMVMERFPLREYFSCIVGADDVGGEGKPSPRIYIKAAKQLDLEPEDCVSIEDSDNGMLSAHRAGLYTIGFRNGHNTTARFPHAMMEIEGFGPENRDRIIELVMPPGTKK